MATLTLRNIPDPIYAKLKAYAERNRRSLNSEAVQRLEESVTALRPDVAAYIERVKQLRKQYKGPTLTADDIDAAINSGRRI